METNTQTNTITEFEVVLVDLCALEAQSNEALIGASTYG
jgi:hypothetical protein